MLAVLLLAALALPRPVGADPAPPELPQHLGIGLAAQPAASGLEGWVPDSGIPFDYLYQYLAGGVNTGNGWQTWNDGGAFPRLYADRAAELGAVPVFPYYMLLQSTGACDGCGEAEQDLAHLNDPGLMATYYADLVTLFERLGPDGFGGTAIVHVEPDLSGYAQHAVLDPSRCFGHCTGTGNDPSLLRASVASSGNTEVAGLPDTFAGFTQAVAQLREAHAPNVLLAFHVSPWAVLHDVATSTNPSLDVVDLGHQAGGFAAAATAGRYDLVFTDVADRDAGWYAQHGRQTWWDRLNVTFPNFHRWETYMRATVDAAGLPAVVWQVPLGNQVFRTVDGSDGHTADNRAEYFFAHPEELVDAGIVAVLFGRGNPGSTTNDDANGDGVTNPPARCTTDGMSSGQVCNDRESTVADDDGGFLREAAAAYYEAPVPLGTRPRSLDHVCPPEEVPPAGFDDVPADSVHAAGIDCVVWKEVAEGTSPSTYSPAAGLTRGQAASLAARAVVAAGGSLPADPPDAFTDDDGNVHEPAIDALAAVGIVSGKDPGVYDPEAPVTRGQLVTLLAGARERTAGEPLPSGQDWFTDDDGSPHEPAIDACATAGIAAGTGPGRFSPNDAVRRDQAASFVARLLDELAARPG